ncbi:MAG: type II toxin-antitoxin system HicB family antitoxin [Thermoguttaceae bacterium]
MIKIEYNAVFVNLLCAQKMVKHMCHIEFPDIDGCISIANTKSEGIRFATEALECWLHNGKYSDLPPARPANEIVLIIPMHTIVSINDDDIIVKYDAIGHNNSYRRPFTYNLVIIRHRAFDYAIFQILTKTRRLFFLNTSLLRL